MVIQPPPMRPTPEPRQSLPSEEDRNAEFLSRATHGFTLEEHSRLMSLGRAAWVQEQLFPTGSDTIAAARILSTLAITRLSGQAYYDFFRTDISRAVREAKNSAITRAILSRWQLRERLVDFWHDHFSVAIQSDGNTRISHGEYDRSVIRANVFGRFEEMLQQSAKSPSMLEYLNGNNNVAGGPNENYAREVLELHTLGVDGPYTETDIRELARCLTGWDYYGYLNGFNAGQFRFRDDRHDADSKVVIGIQIPAGGGVEEGETILSRLASHPSTIDFVSRKLVRRFVSENAPEAAVNIVKSAWQQSGGDLRVITAAVFSDSVADIAEPWNHPKIKRPFQYVAGLLRATGGLSVDAFRILRIRLTDLGQGLFEWPAPDGYPDSSAAWAGGVWGRWDLASDYTRGNLDGIVFPDQAVTALLAGVPDTELAQHIDQLLTGGRSDFAAIDEVQDWINTRGNLDQNELREAIAMVASAPDFLLT